MLIAVREMSRSDIVITVDSKKAVYVWCQGYLVTEI